MTALFKLTQGVPRLINLICHHSLLAAYSTGAKTVSAKLVKAAAVEIFDIEKPKQKLSGKVGWSLVFCSVIALFAGVAFYDDQLTSKTLVDAKLVNAPAKVKSEFESVVVSQPLIEEIEPQPLIAAI